MLRWTDSVSFKELQPQMLLAALRIDAIYHNAGAKECWITSGNDSKHQTGSKHYSGNALDFRIWNLAKELWGVVASSVKVALGREYDVVLEPDHLHVEYDPK